MRWSLWLPHNSFGQLCCLKSSYLFFNFLYFSHFYFLHRFCVPIAPIIWTFMILASGIITYAIFSNTFGAAKTTCNVISNIIIFFKICRFGRAKRHIQVLKTVNAKTIIIFQNSIIKISSRPVSILGAKKTDWRNKNLSFSQFFRYNPTTGARGSCRQLHAAGGKSGLQWNRTPSNGWPE